MTHPIEYEDVKMCATPAGHSLISTEAKKKNVAEHESPNHWNKPGSRKECWDARLRSHSIEPQRPIWLGMLQDRWLSVLAVEESI